jgi:hypothetical protein
VSHRVRVGLAVILLVLGVLVGLLLPRRWDCTPMAYCPDFPRDLNAPFRIGFGLIGIFGVLLLIASVLRVRGPRSEDSSRHDVGS